MYYHGSRGRGGRGRGHHGQNPNNNGGRGFGIGESSLGGGGGSSGGIIRSLETVEAAVAKARNDILAAGGSVSTWKVVQSAAMALQVWSWDSLGVRFHEVPTLRNLQFVEGKVNAFIHCFVSTRRMTSVHELGIELCNSEGVEQFDELGLGPLLRHPLVQHYFSIPPDATEVCKITVEEMIARLTVFQYKRKYKEFTVEEFLDFLMQKYSVTSREKLGVRIQSMGMYIKFIRMIKRTEDVARKSIKESGLPREEPQRSSDSIPEHLKSLSSLIDNSDEINHRTTGTWKDDNDGNVADCSASHSRKGKKCQSHKAQNSADVDEFKWIGLKLAMFNYRNCGQESPENEDLKNDLRARYEIIQTNPVRANKISLTDDESEQFIATWKGVCQKHTVGEILAMMLHIYKTSDKKKRKMERLFLSFPAVGILNIAVRAIKCGELDRANQNPEENMLLNPISKINTEVVHEPPSEGDEASDDEKCTPKVHNNTSADDIVEHVASYFGLDHLVPGKDRTMEEQAVFRDCEIWLSKRLLVKDFKCLGHGCFTEFLERNISLLPHEIQYLMTADTCHKSSMEVSMLQQQFLTFLFQVARALRDSTVLTGQYISILLRKQFPLMNFQLARNGPERNFLDLFKNQVDFDIPTSVTFSVALSMTRNASSLQREDFHREPFEMQCKSVGALGSVSASDAIKCLLRVPMLADLQSWSHWDLIFAPSLGPLLEWLLSIGCIKELSCIVTCDGKIIRVDHSATLDEFLEASVVGSSFQAAVKLLSLFNMYGGSCNIPVALLKCYCQRAFDVTIKNYTDKSNAYAGKGSLVQHSFLHGHIPGAIDGSMILFDHHCVGAELQLGSRFCEDLSQINKAHAVIAKFILQCLYHLPSEFRSTAADIFVSSFQSFTKDAALVMLHVCKTTNERIMLHDIGLSLGIIEWVHDHQEFSSPLVSDLFSSSETISRQSEHVIPTTSNLLPTDDNCSAQTIHYTDSTNSDSQVKEFCEAAQTIHVTKERSNAFDYCIDSFTSKSHEVDDAVVLIQKIRHEEFGLDPNLENAESSLITKQHARLGRALHCLSQELYSQDSHFILELVQNADDNTYPENVEPTLVFILQEADIVVLNNEQGFSAENIRALCDVGCSTKKGSDAGYIGKKGIGFKSVFRVSDAPEIHSNKFHVKFDITEGQIGFILPTLISPCNIDFYKEQLFGDSDRSDATSWNTCIVLPFNSKIKKDTGMGPVISMFSDLHPSLLLFLQRLQCIKFKNMLDNKLITMRREILKNGIVRVSHGNVRICWLVVDKYLQASFVRPDVRSTKISIAFTLQDSDNGGYTPCLDQQPVFSFLPLRNYGLKFILQGDFVLPSSREEVDGDSAWNQWLLPEFPDLFVSAEKSFCMLPCFQKRPGKAVTAFMSFVPLMGEVHWFFSQLPHMILSKLRLSNCLLLDGSNVVWVRPCKVLRNWNEEVRKFIPETLLQQHFGLGYLCKDIILPDSLAKALGVQEYGPKFLIDLLSSICHYSDGIKSLGLYWLSSWLNALYTSLKSLSVHSSGYLSSANVGNESELLNCLRQISFIPLSDGSYGSLAKGPIWLPYDVLSFKHEGESSHKRFPGLYARLRTVNPLLFSTEATINGNLEDTRDNLIRMLCKIGVQKFSAHDIIRNHILPSISVGKTTNEDANLMIEYLSFIMIHLLSACVNCNAERHDIILELRKKPVILTNHGYKCPIEEPIHFSKEFGNSIDLHKLLRNTDIKWNEIKAIYLKHSSTLSVLNRQAKWREFFQELGVTDFVQVAFVERNVLGVLYSGVERNSSTGNLVPSKLFVKDWESAELDHLLCAVSSNKSVDKSKYLLEILDKMWDDCYSPKAKCYIPSESTEETLDSSFMKTIHKFKWVVSSIDEDVHYPKDLFYDCESVRSILGVLAPYAVPKVTSKLFLEDIQFKVQVTLDDALRVIRYWRDSELSASISQMSKLYTFIRDELSLSKEKITEVRTSISIFVPLVYTPKYMDVLPGKFMPPDKVYWHDPTGCLDRLKEKYDEHNSASEIDSPPCMTLVNIYPGLRDFLVTDCGVLETLPFCPYLQILLQLSKNNSPSQAAHEVFQVLVKWADDLESGFINAGNLLDLKESLLKLENTVLPTVQGKWVSLHPQFGLVCWSGDDELMEQCMHLNDVYFLQFGDLTVLEKEKLSSNVATLMQNIGVRNVTEVVSREAIFYGIADCTATAALICWVIPYVQRYLYKFHPDVYFHVKHCELEKLAQLQVIAVEKLFYRYSLNGHSAASTKRYECSCLLQGDIFYTTPSVDSHSMFLELTRFFHGTPQLQTANFLHMIANLSKLGSTAEEIESFVSSKQKVPGLPDGEPSWSSSLFTFNSSESLLPTNLPFMMSKKQYSNLGKKQFNTTNWPPTNWKTAPDFHSPSNMQVLENPGGAEAEKMQIITLKDPEVLTHQKDWGIPNEIDDKYIVKDDLGTAASLTLQQSIEVGHKPDVASNSEQTYQMPISITACYPDLDPTSSSTFAMRDKLCLGIPEVDKTCATGRLGEIIAYKYFTEKLGPAVEVRWVNEEAETGLPYDLIIGKKGSREYIEVKSTTSATKDWFQISTKEFHYAYEKGDSFSIAWVVMSSTTSAEISVFKNPLKHCKENTLQLALLVPQGSDISIT